MYARFARIIMELRHLYVCIYVCMYVCILCMHAGMYICLCVYKSPNLKTWTILTVRELLETIFDNVSS